MTVEQTPKTPHKFRRQIKQRIDRLSAERLTVADDFLAYLEHRESDEATAELLRIPGLLEAVDEAKRDVAAGRTTDWRNVRRDV